MTLANGVEAVALGLLDGGVRFVTAYPGFYAHELGSLLGVSVFSVNEKNAFAMAWGASVAGVRSAVAFKNVGLNDAADPYVNACTLGVRAGMVLVVLDDIDVEQSQILQDSRPYADFPCSLWLEPRSIQEAYDLARRAPDWSEELQTLAVIRLTNAAVRVRATITRSDPVQAEPRPWVRAPERWVAHPVYGEQQRRVLEERRQRVAQYVDALYPPPQLPPGTSLAISVGMAAEADQVAKDPGSGQVSLSFFTLPLPRPWLDAIADWAGDITVREHGGPYVTSKVAAARGLRRLAHRSPCGEADRRYRVTDRYEPLYRILRRVPQRVVVGDLGGHTLDFERTVDACLCFGCSIGVATGIALAAPELHVFCVVGDTAFRHSGKLALEEAVDRQVPITVILLDNGGSRGTGGQCTAGHCDVGALNVEYRQYEFSAVAVPECEALLMTRPERPRVLHMFVPF